MPEEKYLVKHDASGKIGVCLYFKCLFETLRANLDQIHAKTLKNIKQTECAVVKNIKVSQWVKYFLASQRFPKFNKTVVQNTFYLPKKYRYLFKTT